MNSYKVVIIGGGNVASHLIRSITSSGNKLIQIYNRTPSNVDSAATNVIGNIGQISQDADIYIVCVKDKAISEVVKNIQLKDKLIVHTSGNRSMDLLKNCSQNYGVFYPLQSFTKDIPIQFKKIPLVIEASNESAQEILVDFSRTISEQVILMDETQRQKLNIAGVLVNNFTNHLYTLAYDYLKSEHIDFELLKPLIQNTVDKLQLGNPSQMQTGPAIRNDLTTINSHREQLKSNETLLKLYNEMTESILKSNNSSN